MSGRSWLESVEHSGLRYRSNPDNWKEEEYILVIWSCAYKGLSSALVMKEIKKIIIHTFVMKEKNCEKDQDIYIALGRTVEGQLLPQYRSRAACYAPCEDRPGGARLPQPQPWVAAAPRACSGGGHGGSSGPGTAGPPPTRTASRAGAGTRGC